MVPPAATPSPFGAAVRDWRRAFDDRGSALCRDLQRLYGEECEAWRRRYGEALSAFSDRYPGGGEGRPVVLSRCPGQMNIMGMHIDYGGMPSLRLAVRGHDTVTVAAARDDDRVSLHSTYQGDRSASQVFEPVDFRLSDMAPAEPLASRQDLMDYAGALGTRRERETGNTMDDRWGILPQGQLVYLDSWLRLHGRRPGGMDALLLSNVSPSGGMSSSSALVISTAFAVLGLHGLRPGRDISWEDVIDGVGTSEWIRGTRGGTADHGGMVLGRAGSLVSVGVFPARDCGSAPLPEEYVAVLLDSGVPRVYDEAGKEETVLAYPLGTYLLRDMLLPGRFGAPGWEGLVPGFRERVEMIRDLTPENLGLTTAQLCELLAMVPERTSLAELEASARCSGGGRRTMRCIGVTWESAFPIPVPTRRSCCGGGSSSASPSRTAWRPPSTSWPPVTWPRPSSWCACPTPVTAMPRSPGKSWRRWPVPRSGGIQGAASPSWPAGTDA